MYKPFSFSAEISESIENAVAFSDKDTDSLPEMGSILFHSMRADSRRWYAVGRCDLTTIHLNV